MNQDQEIRTRLTPEEETEMNRRASAIALLIMGTTLGTIILVYAVTWYESTRVFIYTLLE